MSSNTNLYRALLELIPGAPLRVATVASVHTSEGASTVTWPGGNQQRVRGTLVAAGKPAFVRGDVIEGEAPALALLTIEV